MRFLLVDGAGMHIDKNGKIYKSGEIIESDIRLDQRLRNKFVLLDGDKPKATPRKKRQTARRAKRGSQTTRKQ